MISPLTNEWMIFPLTTGRIIPTDK
jgi:hypothetical protein